MVLGSTPKLRIVRMLLCYSTLELIISEFIYPDTFFWVLLKIVCGTYPNRTYGFDWPKGLSKVVMKVLVGSSYYSSDIYQF